MTFSDSCDVTLLVKKCREGDELAFEELIHRYERMFSKIAGNLLLDDREVYSDACLALRRAADDFRFDGKVTFGLYAKICVTRAMVDYARKNKSLSSVTIDFDVDELPVADGVQSRLEREEELKNFRLRARELLSDYEYDVFTLTMKGYKTADIARELCKSAKSVDNAKARMLKHLREGLGSAPEI